MKELMQPDIDDLNLTEIVEHQNYIQQPKIMQKTPSLIRQKEHLKSLRLLNNAGISQQRSSTIGLSRALNAVVSNTEIQRLLHEDHRRQIRAQGASPAEQNFVTNPHGRNKQVKFKDTSILI
jgi:hypothetical protein